MGGALKTQPTPEQKRAADDITCAFENNHNLSDSERIAFAQACALDRIAQAIEKFAAVVEKATAKEGA